MLDLEENHSDMNSLQQTLCVSYTEEEDVDWGQELSMLLNDDCMSIPVVRNTMPAVREEQPASAPAEVTLEVVPVPSQQGGSATEETVKKTEPAVIQEVMSV
jgi:hypothetical protein